MRTSESIAKIAPALVKAQAECMAAVKDKTGKIESRTGRSYEYAYADFASVVDIIKPALAKHELAMIQWADRVADGITVITRLQHASGEWQETDTPIPVVAVSAQHIGSALSYGKRYGAQAAMFMASADDDDAATVTPAEPDPSRPNTARQVAVDALSELSASDQKYLHDMAVTVIDLADNNDDAHGYIEKQKLSTEQRLGLWAMLPSGVRSKLQNASRAANAAAKQKEL